MKSICLLMVMVCACAESSVYPGYNQPYSNYPNYPNYQWNYQLPFQPKPVPKPRPVVPGSPQWKRLEFIKKYQAFQRSRTGDVVFGPTSKKTTNFEKEALLFHNDHRRIHQVDDLQLDHTLSKQAGDYARRLADEMKIEHSSSNQRPDQHENIAAGCKVAGPGLTAMEAVRYWYQTICHHNWIESKPNDKARPFTNMIWKSSKKLGIGFAKFRTRDGFNCSVIVARYYPYDGLYNDFSSNVNKGLFEPTSCQYVNNRDKPDFVEPASSNCKVTTDFHGQMVDKDSSCTFSQLFNVFGASKRKGKLAFRVVL